MAYLALVRHGESEWNAKGLWTGWTDVGLSEKGFTEAQAAGEAIQDIHFDYAFVSDLLRAKQTLEKIQEITGQTDMIVISDPAIKERDYGDYTGKNKWEIKKEVGDEKFQEIRRSWDYPIPNGESLKMVYERVLPYYQEEILPLLKMDKNVLVSAHGNSLRALIKYLEHISDEDISKLEMPTGGVYVYQIDQQGNVINKEIRTTGNIH